jgi:anti-sigma B factor antagonist
MTPREGTLFRRMRSLSRSSHVGLTFHEEIHDVEWGPEIRSPGCRGAATHPARRAPTRPGGDGAEEGCEIDPAYRTEQSVLEDGIGLVRLHGEFDLSARPDLEARIDDLVQAGATNIIADVSNATLVDATTLGTLVRGLHRVRPKGGTLVIVGGQPHLVRLFELTGLDAVFPIYGTLEEAAAAVRHEKV